MARIIQSSGCLGVRHWLVNHQLLILKNLIFRSVIYGIAPAYSSSMRNINKTSMNKAFYLMILLSLTACGKNGGATPYVHTCPTGSSNTNQLHAFGDSITVGYGNEVDGQYDGYAIMLAAKLNLALDDCAVAGSVIAANGQFPTIMMSTINPGQTYVFLTGYNDMSYYGDDQTHLAQYQANLQQIFDHLNLAGVNFYIGNTLPMADYAANGSPGKGSAQTVADYNAVISSIAGSHLVDVSSGFNTATMTSGDNVHPNALGHEYLANTFFAAIQ
jgi:lysophospholipase L1-like esterase